jgi:hypothetical protein
MFLKSKIGKKQLSEIQLEFAGSSTTGNSKLTIKGGSDHFLNPMSETDDQNELNKSDMQV